MVTEALARTVTAHVIADLAMPDLLGTVARATLDRRNEDLGMPARVMLVLRDGGRRDAMPVREMPARRVVLGMLVRHRVAGDRMGLARKLGMVVREVIAVPKADRSTVREDLRLAVPDRSIVDRSLVRREVPMADAVMPGLGVSMVARRDEVMIADVDLVVLRSSLGEARLVVLRRS